MKYYKDDNNDIQNMKPGITGISSPFYIDEESGLEDKENVKEIKLSRECRRNSSSKFDLKLIFLTILRFARQTLILKKISNFAFAHRKSVVISIHLIIFVTSCFLAFLVRFEGGIHASYIDLFFKYLPLLIIFRVMFVACLFEGRVKICCILSNRKWRVKIAATTKPLLGGYNHAGVHVYRRHKRAVHVCH